MMQRIRDFRDLVIWQRAVGFAKEVYALSSRFPKDERFGLIAQLRRASVSVSSNIAEGHTRQGKEFSYFLSIARGSLAEAESQLYLSVELGFLTPKDLNNASSIAQEIRRMASKLTSTLEARQSRG